MDKYRGYELSPKDMCGYFNLPSYTYQTTVIFGIMEERSILMHGLASFNCFIYRNLFQNGANDMSEMVKIVNDFLSKSSKLSVVRIVRFCSNFTFVKELQIVFIYLFTHSAKNIKNLTKEDIS